VGSDDITFVTSFMKISKLVQKLKWVNVYSLFPSLTHTLTHMPVCYLLWKDSRLNVDLIKAAH